MNTTPLQSAKETHCSIYIGGSQAHRCHFKSPPRWQQEGVPRALEYLVSSVLDNSPQNLQVSIRVMLYHWAEQRIKNTRKQYNYACLPAPAINARAHVVISKCFREVLDFATQFRYQTEMPQGKTHACLLATDTLYWPRRVQHLLGLRCFVVAEVHAASRNCKEVHTGFK